MPAERFRSVEDAFARALEQGVFPGAALLVAQEGAVTFEHGFGFCSLGAEKRPVRESTLFDLASLTKPLATTTAAMLLIADRKVGLDESVARFFPTLEGPGKSSITVRMLLAHCSGFPAWRPYYQEVVSIDQSGPGGFIGSPEARQFIYNKVQREELLFEPGSKELYSDLGFILLGELVEKLAGHTLNRFCHDRIFEPIGMRSARFFSVLEPRADLDIAATQHCPWRKRVLEGEVDDDNAYAMGGVAGHAGLFSNARDIHLLLGRLRLCCLGKDDFVPSVLARRFFEREETVAGGTHALGWDTPSEKNSSSGRRFSPHSVGHLGFTGTSIWWDLEKDCYIILLTNRVHPSRENEKIKEFRPLIHDLIMTSLGL
ncbi:MAG: serine hydrolase domain-containing protein [Candidatus Binatia bacterium]